MHVAPRESTHLILPYPESSEIDRIVALLREAEISLDVLSSSSEYPTVMLEIDGKMLSGASAIEDFALLRINGAEQSES